MFTIWLKIHTGKFKFKTHWNSQIEEAILNTLRRIVSSWIFINFYHENFYYDEQSLQKNGVLGSELPHEIIKYK